MKYVSDSTQAMMALRRIEIARKEREAKEQSQKKS